MSETKKKRKPWTAKHRTELRVLARRKRPARDIARKLRRTESAIRQYAHSIGLSLDTRAAA